MLGRLSILFLGVSLAACSSSSDGGGTTQTDTGTSATDTGTTPTDTGTATDTGSATDTGTADTGPAPLNGCADADFVDATTDAAKRIITPWNTSVGTRCLTIKVGQSVTWDGVPNATHPLEASGGDTPSPITNTSPITFPNAGTFGFHCANHPSVMKGVIKVVP